MHARRSQTSVNDPPDFPATRCLKAIFEADNDRLRKLDPERTAKHYGICPEWVRFSRDHELASRR